MTDAIIAVLEWINDMVLGMASDQGKLTGTFRAFMPSLYDYSDTIMRSVIQPVAYTVLALFLLLEIHKIVVKTDSMTGNATNFGSEIVFKVLFKATICKIVVDNIPLLLNGIYSFTTSLTVMISSIGGTNTLSGGIDVLAIETSIDNLNFWSGLIYLILAFLVFLISFIAVILANVMICARFIELFLYFSVAPIPIATLPSEEMSQIGKNFIKNFTAVCLQGTLIFIVLTFFPYLFNSRIFTYTSTFDIFAELMGILGYSVVLLIAIFATGKWAKAICNAI